MIRSQGPQTVQKRATPSISGERWQHPSVKKIRVPRKVAAVIALIQTGIVNYSTIAQAVGLTVEEVKYIDQAEESKIRQLGIQGIPRHVYFHLKKKVRCPNCNSWITLAPCVACSLAKEPDPATA